MNSERIKKLLSAILLAAVGAVAGGIVGIVGTILLYGIGVFVGVPVGFIVGGFRGWRLPLRDSTIIFIFCFGALALASIGVFPRNWSNPENPVIALLRWIALPVGALSAYLCLRFVSFSARRTLALRLVILAFILFITTNLVIAYWRSPDPAPLLASWMHPKETLAFHPDGTLTETWRRSFGTGHLQRRWFRAGEEIYIEGAVGYNQWLRCRWKLAPGRQTLTLTKYYESGEIVTMEYRRIVP